MPTHSAPRSRAACAPSFSSIQPRRAALIGVALSSVTLLAACGGGGGGSEPAPVDTTPVVNDVSYDRLSFARLSTFTLTGENLAEVTVAATGCTGLAELAGGTATQRRFTCTPDNTLRVQINATQAGTAYSVSSWTVLTPIVRLATSAGDIVVELDPAKAPVTVRNFLDYVNANFYNGTIFHRLVAGFVNQGGGFTGVLGNTLVPQTNLRAPIALEVGTGLSNLRGTIAMARGAEVASATSQFFFNVADNVALDTQAGGYAVFGKVSSASLPVLDAINGVATRSVGLYTGVPVTDIVVQTATQLR